jgi:formylglycine-generating enzyme required for sulfatase activity
VSKIFGPGDAQFVAIGQSSHHNDYGCNYVGWYGGMCYSLWMGGMLPTVAQWYYAACATDTNGGKAAVSYYPSPVEKTNSLVEDDRGEDVQLGAIAWYYYNSDTVYGVYNYNKYNDDSRSVHQVAKKAPNSVGLYDVCGNLAEICLDWYEANGSYSGSGQDGVSTVASYSNGDWRASRSNNYVNGPRRNSLGNRGNVRVDVVNLNYGFRLAVAP